MAILPSFVYLSKLINLTEGSRGDGLKFGLPSLVNVMLYQQT